MATFEDLKYITPITINSRERIFRSETINLKVQAVGNGAQRWDLTITLAPASGIGGNAAGAALGVHRSTHGATTPFDMAMPQYLNVAEPVNTVLVNGEVTAGSAVAVDASDETVIAAGRFFAFQGSRKIYQVTEEVTVPDTGTRMLNFFPPLVATVADNATIDWDPMIQVYYAQDGVEGVTYSDGVLTRATLNVVEAL